MKVTETNLPGVMLIEPTVFEDPRGFFKEVFHEARYKTELRTQENFVQDNLSRSTKGVLRGLHFQINKPQGKLVQVTSGEVFDVAVDINPQSLTFKEWFGTHLTDKNHHQLYIPPGYAHGFLVLSETADFQYKCTDYYAPEDQAGILWNDPDIGIEWPMDTQPVVSERDQGLPSLKAYFSQ
jgi:dTDP-4-dehydrorhamnose 3,5-epimerase